MSDNTLITVGKLAKMANTTVRTLQYYDNENIIKPTALSEGGRRLYTEKDLSTIHQVITLKSLGLSLKEIKGYLIKVETSNDLLRVLEQQSLIVQRQISQFSKLYESIILLQKDVTSTKVIDWEKYGKMMEMVKQNNEYYWVINFLDKDLLKDISDVHEINESEEFQEGWLKSILLEAITLSEQGISPTSDKGLKLASKWWDRVSKYINGDPKKLQKLYDFYENSNDWPTEFGEMQQKSKEFLEQAIGSFMMKNNIIETLKTNSD